MNPLRPGEKFRYLRRVVHANRRLAREGIIRIDYRRHVPVERPVPVYLVAEEPIFFRRQAC